MRYPIVFLLLLFGCSTPEGCFNAPEMAYLESNGFGPYLEYERHYERIELRDTGLYRTWIYMMGGRERGCDVYIWRETSGTDRWVPVRHAATRNISEAVVFAQRWMRDYGGAKP